MTLIDQQAKLLADAMTTIVTLTGPEIKQFVRFEPEPNFDIHLCGMHRSMELYECATLAQRFLRKEDIGETSFNQLLNILTMADSINRFRKGKSQSKPSPT